jgi:hypothetical protein
MGLWMFELSSVAMRLPIGMAQAHPVKMPCQLQAVAVILTVA